MMAPSIADIVVQLAQNISLFALVVAGYSTIRRRRLASILVGNLAVGLLFGLGAIMAMAITVHVTPSVRVDGRSILIGLAAFFGGPPGALVAAAIAATYRLWLGGGAALAGAAAIVSAAIVSIGFRAAQRRLGLRLTAGLFILLGFAVVTQALANFVLWRPDATANLAGLLAILLYLAIPAGTVILGLALCSIDERLALENRLREQTQLLQTVFESMSDGVTVANYRGEIVLANPVSVALAGATALNRPRGDQQTAHDVFHGDGKTRFGERDMPLARALRGEVTDNIEMVLRDGRSGKARLLSADARPLIGSDGTPQGGVMVFRDMTAQRRAEERLKEAIGVIDSGFALFDADDKLVICNESFVDESMRRALGDPVGRSFAEIVRHFASTRMPALGAPADREAWLQWRMKRHQDPPEEPFEIELTDGRWMQVTERRTAEGGYVGLWTDITRVKRAEERLRHAIDSLADGFALFDRNDRVVICNEPFRETSALVGAGELTGRSMESILRHFAQARVTDVGTGEDPEAWVQWRLARHRNPPQEPYEQHLTDGRWLKIAERRTSDGGRVGIWSDITAQKTRELDLQRSKQQLEQQAAELVALAENLERARAAADKANHDKSRFLASMSHELRTPLNAILGFSEMIGCEIYGPLQPARYREYITMIHDSGTHLLSLINDVLDLSKIEAGKMELRIVELRSDDTARQAAATMEELASMRGVHLEVVAEKDCPVFHGDARAVKQIILNLLSNAIKFTPANGTVTLRISKAGATGVEITVTDTGAGMTPDQVAKALQPFGQVETNLEVKDNGTGLGLPLTQSLAELHGGRLTISSDKGKGTTVTVLLPWSADLAPPAPAKPAASEPAASAKPAGPRVLLAEDNGFNRRVFTEVLGTLGARVDCVEDGEAAIEQARREAYDVILMDVEMPRMDGVTATRQIRALPGKLGRTPIIAVTAHHGTEQRERYLAAGMNEVISKPINVSAFISAVSTLASRAA
jgi:signal transduction histidine kinase/ActR/RegA family two-component response regulator